MCCHEKYHEYSTLDQNHDKDIIDHDNSDVKSVETMFIWIHCSPVDSISLHPGKTVLIDSQHQLKASSHTLDILRALQRKEANIYPKRRVSLSRGIRKTTKML